MIRKQHCDRVRVEKPTEKIVNRHRHFTRDENGKYRDSPRQAPTRRATIRKLTLINAGIFGLMLFAHFDHAGHRDTYMDFFK